MIFKINRQFYCLTALISLAAGTLIYLLFRDLSNILLFTWIPTLEFPKTVLIQLNPSIFSYILKYNMPDMLWFLSGILFLRFIWFNKAKEQKFYVFCFYIVGVVFETSQLFDVIPGTFDWLDLLFMGIGAFIEGLLFRKFVI